jgi:epoxyqueuosine reductase
MNKPPMITETIKRNLNPPEEFIYGFSDLRGLIHKKYSHYPYGISIGKRLNNSIVDGIMDGPTLDYYRHYKQVNKELSAVAHKITSDLKKTGVDAVVIEPTVSTESKEFEKYLETLTVEVSHKMVATRAGLGWIGKTDLFVSKAFGPRLRLVSLLISEQPAHEPRPIEKSHCGSCQICVDKCPAGAANGILWNTAIHRDLFFDAHRCRETCGKLAMERLKVNVRICGLCVAVCPIGEKRRRV